MDQQLSILKKKLEELERKLPAHSIPISMLIEIENLEEEIAALELRQNQ